MLDRDARVVEPEGVRFSAQRVKRFRYLAAGLRVAKHGFNPPRF